ncbi:hydroxyethylthiazole kinase [Companilactobacillus ginsenosidimutans]|uniref:Hydroxyethylthiazole kinase n=1 Tax=Companilactobacillus ginsenosidimutans TaxID=1007676 RepID=A0A0H4QKG3_9LACO|nr:hydroxyethylthiazole kinase [Companilactobacillus ginsenosidimutans]AKP67571.1 hydroxyethylthiazole kinase [Companilactobacillus ginsenosidimutans]
MENYSQNDSISKLVKCKFPLSHSPLVHCITNEITIESVANALLYINAKPVMVADIREFPELFEQIDSLFLNLGHISPEREIALLEAGKMASSMRIPFVIDLVGIVISKIRFDLSKELLDFKPTIVKGNISEMRTFCGLSSHGRGVDSASSDQSSNSVDELMNAMFEKAQNHPETTFIATGATDLIVSKNSRLELKNGVPELDRFTGTGDIVGALMTALVEHEHDGLVAGVAAISYLNICAENAIESTEGLADFRQETLNQLSLLINNEYWYESIRGALHA